MMKLIDLCGIHKLSGVETGEDSIRFILDGVAYEAVEDPDDGYRSYMGELNITDKRIRFTFSPVEVLCSMNNDEEILEIRDTNNGETILRLGTDYSDSYYPQCVFNWMPEKMACNGYAKR